MTSLKRQTVSGIKWLVTSSFLQKAISFIATVVLARILSPSVFGLYALAFVAIDGLTMFKSMGFDTALIRKSDDAEKAANTAFFIIPVLGIIIYLVLAFSAPLIGKFLNNQEVPAVIRALGVIYIISCFGKVPAAILEKNMQFRKISIIEISAAIIYTITAILLAVSGVGIWSLVIAYVAKTVFQNIMFWVYSKWRPRFEFDKKIALEMFHFGKFIFLGSLVYFLRMNLDNLLVGKLLGVASLGLYAIAFNIANFGADYFGGKVHRVVFPAYSKLQNNLNDLRQASLKVLKHISLIAFPLGTGIFMIGDDFLRFAYGEKWLGAAGVLKILAWAGVFNTLPAGLSGVFLACGKPKLTFWITSLQVMIFLIFITPMANLFDINGVGAVVGVSSFIAFVITLICAMKILAMNPKMVFRALCPALIASIIMGLGIALLKSILISSKMNAFFQFNFILLTLSSFLIYVFSLIRLEKMLLREIKEVIF